LKGLANQIRKEKVMSFFMSPEHATHGVVMARAL